MKTIVVPTDFSPSAENAMTYAGVIAQAINAAVLLVHVYQIPVSMNEAPILTIPPDELKRYADAGLERAKNLLQKNYSDIDIKIESRLGDVTDEVNDVCKNNETFLVVTGNHGGDSGFERFLFGSTSLSIIRHTKFPVIAVPDSTTKKEVKNIALAVDNSTKNIPSKVQQMVETFHAQLKLIHVKTDKDEFNWSDSNIPVQTIRDNEFVHGIENYIQSNNIDLLAILPHKHNLMEKIFFKTHTPQLLQKLSVPIMCVSEDNTN